MKLTKEAKKKFRGDIIRNKLAKAVNRSRSTIDRWIKKDTHFLINERYYPTVKRVIGITKDELFEVEEDNLNSQL
ncbi:hypothetical protein [uncultured Capnocytophaga sp.]|uniref:hypothetical protein n=1 Tax=uncultured Capnocytophaga sp. TaxID=159273 RepID=UPI0028EB0E4E|nr:hypothetical protein [uncultured Capnocytophaga sp.]